MAHAHKVSRRPPKSWWRHCVKHVKDTHHAISPERVCGAAWAGLSRKGKQHAKRTHRD